MNLKQLTFTIDTYSIVTICVKIIFAAEKAYISRADVASVGSMKRVNWVKLSVS